MFCRKVFLLTTCRCRGMPLGTSCQCLFRCAQCRLGAETSGITTQHCLLHLDHKTVVDPSDWFLSAGVWTHGETRSDRVPFVSLVDGCTPCGRDSCLFARRVRKVSLGSATSCPHVFVFVTVQNFSRLTLRTCYPVDTVHNSPIDEYKQVMKELATKFDAQDYSYSFQTS